MLVGLAEEEEYSVEGENQESLKEAEEDEKKLKDSKLDNMY